MGIDPIGLGMLSSPTQLTAVHNINGFDCGNPIINSWLSRWRATDTAKIYVILEEDCVAGFYTLSAGAIARIEAIGSVARNSPDPIPVILLGQFAVGLKWQGQGYGSDLLRDALLRCIHISEIIGVRAVLLQAIDDQAVRFYQRFGFQSSLFNKHIMMVTIKHLRANH